MVLSGGGTTTTKSGTLIYRKMAPDDLHAVFGGVLGKHFINILGKVGLAAGYGRGKNPSGKQYAFGHGNRLECRRNAARVTQNPLVLLELQHHCLKQYFLFSTVDGHSTPCDILAP
jgi:hypothetical protein